MDRVAYICLLTVYFLVALLWLSHRYIYLSRHDAAFPLNDTNNGYTPRNVLEMESKSNIITGVHPRNTNSNMTYATNYKHTLWYNFSTNHMSIYAYSAHYDNRLSGGDLPYVRILAVAENITTAYCHFWFSGKRYPRKINAIILKHGESRQIRGHLLEPVIISCICESVHYIPSHITVGTTRHPDMIRMPVNVPEHSELKIFGICVPITYGHIDPYRIVEWVEMHRFFGVRDINIYTSNVSEDTLSVLKYFALIGYIHLHQVLIHDLH